MESKCESISNKLATLSQQHSLHRSDIILSTLHSLQYNANKWLFEYISKRLKSRCMCMCYIKGGPQIYLQWRKDSQALGNLFLSKLPPILSGPSNERSQKSRRSKLQREVKVVSIAADPSFVHSFQGGSSFPLSRQVTFKGFNKTIS